MEKIVQLIEENAEKTGNKSGLTPVQLSHASGIPLPQLRQLLNQAYTTGQAIVKEGINSKLVFGI